MELTDSDDSCDPVLRYETRLVRPLAVQGTERVDDQGDDDPIDCEGDSRKREQDASESQWCYLRGQDDHALSVKSPSFTVEALCRLTSPI